MNEKPYELVGFFSGIDEGPSFVIPLFQSRASNMFLVQEIGGDDTIRDFREVDPRNVCRLDGAGERVDIGDQGIWGFRDAAMRPIIATREQLRNDLLPLLQQIDQPFLRLQVAQFCEDQGEIVDGWRRAFAHLEERSPRSASAWRDVVVIPTQARLAVETAILSNGLDLPTDRLARQVDVSVNNGQLRLLLEAKMHAALSRHDGARSTLEQLATPVRQAFRLAATSLELISRAEGANQEGGPDADQNGIAIVGFGKMAMSLLAQVFPRINRPPAGQATTWLAGANERQVSALLQGAQLRGEREWATADEDDFAPLVSSVETVLVVFQLGQDQPTLMDRAISFASSCRQRDRRVVAVVPHLPQEFEETGALAHSIIPALRQEFDSIWALSDRSPYTRQSLPFGPARSTQAAAAHFRALMHRAEEGELRLPMKVVPKGVPSIGVIGSAVGDQPITRLVEHAVLRLRHDLLDFRSAAEASIVSIGQQDAFKDVVREIVHRDAPDAKVRLSSVPKKDGGPARVTVALAGVALLAGGAKEFERYCAGELERFGWSIDQFEPDGALHISKGGDEHLPVSLRHVGTASLEAAMKARKRRRHEIDGIMLTNATVRRRAFAHHTLNGLVPIHSSRIEALQRIYRRRYAYAIGFLRQEVKAAERVIVPTALDWLNLHPCFDNRNVGKAKIAAEGQPNLDFDGQVISLSLPLEVSRGRGRASTVERGQAHIMLNDGGWRLLRLSVADRIIHEA